MGRYAPRHRKRLEGFSEGKRDDGVPHHARPFIGLSAYTVYITKYHRGGIYIDTSEAHPPYLYLALEALEILVEKIKEKKPIHK